MIDLVTIQKHLDESNRDWKGFVLGSTNSRDTVALKNFKEDVPLLIAEVKHLERALERACAYLLAQNPDHGFQTVSTWRHYFEADDFFDKWDEQMKALEGE